MQALAAAGAIYMHTKTHTRSEHYRASRRQAQGTRLRRPDCVQLHWPQLGQCTRARNTQGAGFWAQCTNVLLVVFSAQPCSQVQLLSQLPAATAASSHGLPAPHGPGQHSAALAWGSAAWPPHPTPAFLTPASATANTALGPVASGAGAGSLACVAWARSCFKPYQTLPGA